MSSKILIHLGDLRLTVMLAGGVLAWLMASHCYGVACWWGVAFGSAMGAVTISKILYLVWGLENDVIEFKAISGHAAGAAAVLPIALYVLTTGFGRARQHGAWITGGLVSVVVAVSLVRNNEHSASEAFAGWCIGVTASGATWDRLRRSDIQPSLQYFYVALASTIAIAACLHWMPIGWWLVKLARLLSGGQRLHHWNAS